MIEHAVIRSYKATAEELTEFVGLLLPTEELTQVLTPESFYTEKETEGELEDAYQT